MALLFTGTDDPPYNPLKTDEVCALSLSLTDWNITQNPDPVTYTSLRGGDPLFPGLGFKHTLPIIDSPTDDTFRFTDGSTFTLPTGPAQEFLRGASTMGNEITDSLNLINPNLSGDIKALGANINENGLNFNSVAGGVLFSNTYQDFEREVNEEINDSMTAFGILDKDKWQFEIGLDHIPEDDTVEFISSFFYEQELSKLELHRTEGDGWTPKCGLGVRTSWSTNGYMTVDLTTGEIAGGAGSALNAQAYLELLNGDGQPNGWSVGWGTAAGVDTQEGWYGPGQTQWTVSKSFPVGSRRRR